MAVVEINDQRIPIVGETTLAKYGQRGNPNHQIIGFPGINPDLVLDVGPEYVNATYLGILVIPVGAIESDGDVTLSDGKILEPGGRICTEPNNPLYLRANRPANKTG